MPDEKIHPFHLSPFWRNGLLVARCKGLENVRFLDLQPVERLGELLAMADIHLLPQRADAADEALRNALPRAGRDCALRHLNKASVLAKFQVELAAMTGRLTRAAAVPGEKK